MATPIRALLIDISGTLLVGSSPIPGAAPALAKLRAASIPFRLCSNTSKESSVATLQRLRTAGLDVYRTELWTSIGVLKAVLEELGVKKPYMLLSQSALEECAEDPEPGIDPSGQAANASESELRTHSPPSSSYDAVVVGLAPALLDYAHLNTAFRILVGEDRPRDVSGYADADHKNDLNSDTESYSCADLNHPYPRSRRPPLVALHKARYLEAADHALSLGPGPFVHALEHAAQTSATVVGKPTRAFFEAVLRDLERDLNGVDRKSASPGPSESLPPPSPPPPSLSSSHRDRWEGISVVGDDVLADLGDGAVELGLWRVLVKTGKYRPGDEGRMGVLPPPDQVCESFAQFVETLLVQREKRSSPS